MPPVEHALVAVDAQPDVVLAAGGCLRHGERAARAAVEFEQRRNVIDHLAPRKRARRRRRTTRARVEPGSEAREMLRVAADRAHHQRESAALRIEHPAKRLFCGPSSTRVAMPLWMYSTCTSRTGPSDAVARPAVRA